MDYLLKDCVFKIIVNGEERELTKVIDLEEINYPDREKFEMQLTNINQINNLDYMFSNSYSLYEVNLENLDTSNITSIKNMFNSCNSLEKLYGIENWDTSTGFSFCFVSFLEKLKNTFKK